MTGFPARGKVCALSFRAKLLVVALELLVLLVPQARIAAPQVVPYESSETGLLEAADRLHVELGQLGQRLVTAPRWLYMSMKTFSAPVAWARPNDSKREELLERAPQSHRAER